MIRRLAIVAAAVATLVVAGAAGSQAEVIDPTLGCAWVGSTAVCIDNPVGLLPKVPSLPSP